MADPIVTLRRLAEAATRGQLSIERRDDDCGYMNYILHGAKGDFAWFREELDPRAKQNAELVAATMAALPLLLDLVEAADARILAQERVLGAEPESASFSGLCRKLDQAKNDLGIKRAALAKGLE